ncbi:protein phosphatase 2C domain-containing protein [Nonomuraea turcica]|uniref:protein phosphatase 2C domain-containing protein n=1 Tax=Nonomuraea sp. G32 TaxID=3067274 RepID=UPI00273CC1B2|nr:protein phosphatase 2C domain-containing protein [Nonomuraea sp. G32]MDP4510306.1 SpoIIE family protein phosphatase [Nonomuraea sp. G32]
MIAHSPPGELAVLYYDSIAGGRSRNADYLHICDGGPSMALAVADGEGDHPDAAECAQITAQIAAAVASSTGNPVEALRAAKQYVDDRNHPVPPGQEGVSTATVVAINRFSGISLAWAGNSPVWGITPTGEVVGLTVPSCHPTTTPCNVSQRHSGLWPHSRTVDIGHFVRLIVATDGLTGHLSRDRPDHMAAMTDRLADLAGIHQEGGYALAQLLWLAESCRGRDNITVAVIDLLDHHREGSQR